MQQSSLSRQCLFSHPFHYIGRWEGHSLGLDANATEADAGLGGWWLPTGCTLAPQNTSVCILLFAIMAKELK